MKTDFTNAILYWHGTELSEIEKILQRLVGPEFTLDKDPVLLAKFITNKNAYRIFQKIARVRRRRCGKLKYESDGCDHKVKNILCSCELKGDEIKPDYVMNIIDEQFEDFLTIVNNPKIVKSMLWQIIRSYEDTVNEIAWEHNRDLLSKVKRRQTLSPFENVKFLLLMKVDYCCDLLYRYDKNMENLFPNKAPLSFQLDLSGLVIRQVLDIDYSDLKNKPSVYKDTFSKFIKFENVYTIVDGLENEIEKYLSCWEEFERGFCEYLKHKYRMALRYK